MCSSHCYLGWGSLGCLARERGQSEDSVVARVTECITELSAGAGQASGLAHGDGEGWVGALEADSTAMMGYDQKIECCGWVAESEQSLGWYHIALCWL